MNMLLTSVLLSYKIPVFFQGNYPLKTNRQEIPVF
jgi:hypothetical protein